MVQDLRRREEQCEGTDARRSRESSARPKREGAGGEEAEVILADDRAPGKPHFTRRQNGPKGSGSR